MSQHSSTLITTSRPLLMFYRLRGVALQVTNVQFCWCALVSIGVGQFPNNYSCADKTYACTRSHSVATYCTEGHLRCSLARRSCSVCGRPSSLKLLKAPNSLGLLSAAGAVKWPPPPAVAVQQAILMSRHSVSSVPSGLCEAALSVYPVPADVQGCSPVCRPCRGRDELALPGGLQG